MNGYLLSVIGTVLLSAILTAVLPSGKTAGLIKSIVRLACILAIVSPVLQFFQTGKLSFDGENLQTFFNESGIEGGESYIKYYSEMRIEETERALEEEILEKFGSIASVTFSWETVTETVFNRYENESIKISEIRIKLKEKTSEEVEKKMWEYLTKNYCSEVLIE